ncbi:MAG: class I SAM-dependent methyltransferase [Acidimicrobiia bacterium]
MQDDSGFKSALGLPWAYELFQRAVGAVRARRWLAREAWRCVPQSKVVDVGCGPGDVLEYLPREIDYYGLDISPEYIAQARQRFGDRGRYLVATAGSLIDSPELRGADLILCNGLLHHLDDVEAESVFAFARQTLAPGGRLVCIEPCYLRHQGVLSRWIMGRDRGQNVRAEYDWKQLASRHFPNCRTDILTSMIRLPYVHILIECTA